MRFPVLLALLGAFLGAAAGPVAAAQPLDRIVAVVNDGVVLQSELDRALDAGRRQLAERGIVAPPEEVLRTQVLERLVLMRVQTQRAQQAGIRIDDRELNDVLNNLAAQNKMTLSQFAEALKSDGMDYLSLREQVRDEMLVNRLRAREIDNRVLVSDQDVAQYLATQTGADQVEYRVSHILVAVPDGAASSARIAAHDKANALLKRLQAGEDFAQVAIASSDGQQALQGGDLDWRTGANLPELFANALQKLKPGQLSPVLENASGYHILKLVDSRTGGERKTVTETHSQHILVMTNAVRDEAAAQALIRELHARLVKGEDFGELAKKHSDDPGSKNSGGDLGWQPAGVFAPDFEKSLDALQPGQFSEPFKSPFGWHIAKVLERRERDATDETRKARARQTIQNRRAAEEYDMWLRRLRAEAYVEIRLKPSGSTPAPARS